MPGGFLLGIDRDEEALKAADARLGQTGGRYRLLHGDYMDISAHLETVGLQKLNLVLMDLGVSSHQFDRPERGFSYRFDGPLDMRMDRSQSLTAAEVVNTFTEQEIAKIIMTYGEERWAARIAKFIVESRPLETTFDLVDAIKKAIPRKVREDGGHPARKTFQALRIYVNNELTEIERTLQDVVDHLETGGILAVITFHSLEDRIVKNTFSKMENPCECPKDFPVCVCGKKKTAVNLYRKPIVPTDEETAENNRARSAKLRAVRRV
jgi:16S rRNA (cytosine1402-N4)-methyltransferase